MNFCKPQITAAVNSALRNTKLNPHCIYNGDDPDNISWLEGTGAKVICHKSSFEEDLKFGYVKNFRIFSGHWLRVDIPLIESEDDFVLYTDTDVIFLNHPKVSMLPTILGAVPEFREGKMFFNNGVMVMNVQALKSDHPIFVNNIRERLRNNFTYPAHDQASFNRRYRDKITEIPREFNWRPYWGIGSEVSIVHFHGPKPEEFLDYESDKIEKISETYLNMIKSDVPSYKYYSDLYFSYL